MNDEKDKKAAADLVRQKVDAAYQLEPSAAVEAKQVAQIPAGSKLSKHQKFIAELTASGQPIEDIQTAWHDYYTTLSDSEKHQVWREFYESKRETTKAPAVPSLRRVHTLGRKLTVTREKKPSATRKKRPVKAASPVRSLLFGLASGAIVLLVVLFGFFNERFIAPFIQPSRTISSVPLITNAAIGPEPKVIIPKINVDIPVVYGVNTIEEPTVMRALEEGVVHYAATAQPGQNGNTVIVGHSSNNIFNSGRYKFAFVLLNRLELGDTFFLHKDGQRYTYQVYQKKIVKPTDVSVLAPTDKPAVATLITCDPPGTSINRLVVVAEQISPDPSKNQKAAVNDLVNQTKTIPSNAPTLWSKIWNVISR